MEYLFWLFGFAALFFALAKLIKEIRETFL